MFKRLCRWMLKDEISTLKAQLKGKTKLAYDLAVRLEPYMPPLNTDGRTDNTPMFDFHTDVCQGLGKPFYIPSGNYRIGKEININYDALRIYGDGLASTIKDKE